MKIAFDAKRLFLNKTGLGNYSRTLVRNIQKYYPQHEYVLCTPKVVVDEETAYFVESKKFEIVEYPHFFSSYWRSIGIVSRLQNIGVDIYHGLSHEIPFGLAKAGIKTCVTFHDLIFEKYPHFFPTIDRQLYRLKYKYAAKNSDRIIAVSNNTSKDIHKFWNIPSSKIDVVYQSCGDMFYEKTIPNFSKDYFLYVSAISERKGLLDIVKAYGQLDDKYRIPILIIGQENSYANKVKEVIQKNNLEDLFIFKGAVDNHQLIEYYDRAVALIYPSMYEGFGIPIIEASLRKVPVICSKTSSMPEAGGPDVLYIEPGNATCITTHMKYCLDKGEEVARKAEKSYIYVINEFNPQHTAHSLLRIYEDLMK